MCDCGVFPTSEGHLWPIRLEGAYSATFGHVRKRRMLPEHIQPLTAVRNEGNRFMEIYLLFEPSMCGEIHNGISFQFTIGLSAGFKTMTVPLSLISLFTGSYIIQPGS